VRDNIKRGKINRREKERKYKKKINIITMLFLRGI